MATQHHDDGFHEIQLNGKQLVFLFMAVTVVSVVIFLCGVLVGRGVRAERAASVVEPTSAPATIPESPRPQPAPVPAGSDPTKAAAPPPPGEDLTFFDRLDKKSPSTEQLKPAADKAPAPARGAVSDKASTAAKAPASDKTQSADKAAEKNPAPVKSPEPVKRPPGSAPKEVAAAGNEARPALAAPPASADVRPASSAPDEAAAAGEPAGNGFALQITALREPGEAEAIARRLSAKGYSAYVLKPAAGSPSVYRVRVGKFKTRREAETIATKLHKEEQFTPWITR